jgi:hypothetical protein
VRIELLWTEFEFCLRENEVLFLRYCCFRVVQPDLSTEEFLQHKDELVADVLIKLRHLARLEAELLFREYRNYLGALPHFSERISNAINTATDD